MESAQSAQEGEQGAAAPLPGRRLERGIARVRWVVVALLAAVALGYAAPLPGLAPLADEIRPAVAGLVVGLAAAGLAGELVARRAATPGGLARAGTALLVADTVLVGLFVAVFAFDPLTGQWVLLGLPIVEAAARFRLPGAVLVWLVTIPLAIADVLAAAQVLAVPVAASAIGYRLAALLALAVAGGLAARRLAELRREVTEARAAAAEADARGTERLAALERLRGRLVAAATHDLRLPLTVASGLLGLLRTGWQQLSPEQVEPLLDDFARQTNRLGWLADDLVDAARLEAGPLRLRRGPCDLGELVRAVVGDGSAVELRCEGHLGLHGDAARLQRLVWNLVANAEKHAEPPFELTVRGDEAAVTVELRDHGPGLPAAARHLLDGAGAAEPGCIGLTVVRGIVAAHGGALTHADAEPGARLRVWLPRAGDASEQGGGAPQLRAR